MGHEPGRGLGRTEEGIVEPIKASVVRSRVGLGTEGVNELEPEEVEWEEEEVGSHFTLLNSMLARIQRDFGSMKLL